MPNKHPERDRVAARISGLMTDRGLSLRDMESLTGIPFSTLGRYLRSQSSPSLDQLAAIADALGVTLADLMPEVAA